MAMKCTPSRLGPEMSQDIILILSSLQVKGPLKIYEESLEDDNAPIWKELGSQDQQREKQIFIKL